MNNTDIQNTPGAARIRPPETQGFIFNHVMLRVKDITQSLDFYSRILGFRLVDYRDYPDDRFSLSFLAMLPTDANLPDTAEQRREWLSNAAGVLELTYNYGTETSEGPVYHNGNSDPRGFGHICVAVPDIQAACARFERLKVPFQKRLSDGRMKTIAFLRDPDGYWVEIISRRTPTNS